MNAPAKSKAKLLVPFDFTKEAEGALDFALNYSQVLAADVYLFHVLEGSSRDFRRTDRLNEEYMDRMQQAVVAAHERMTAKGGTAHVENVHRRMGAGKPAAEIIKMAGGINADLIIMGAANSRGAIKMLQKAPCTVVLVKEKDTSFVMVD